jgi:hypothetical protein
MGRRSLRTHDHSGNGNGGDEINPDKIGSQSKATEINAADMNSDRINFDIAVDTLIEKNGGDPINVDVTNGGVFDISLDQNATIDVQGADSNGVYSATLFVADNGNSITWDSAISWEDGNTPSFSDDLRIISLTTRDGGTSWQGIYSGVF